MNRLAAAGRARLRRIRGQQTTSDEGFTLVYVLLVSMIIMIAVSSMMVVTASNIVPARKSQDTQAALAAANAGLQDAIAYLNDPAVCAHTGSRCDGAIGHHATNNRTGTDVLDGSGESFDWTIPGYVTDAAGNTYLRVSSTGTAGHSSKTLVADIQGINGVLDYEYYSTYETLGSKELNSYYSAGPDGTGRKITLDCDKVNAASTADSSLDFSCPAGQSRTVTWNGASTSSPSDSVCDKLWYDSATLNGADAKGRANTQFGQGLPKGADYVETGTVKDASGNVVATPTRDAPCQVAFNSDMTFDGPVYTVDAPLISNKTSNGTGPTFDKSFNTAWGTSSNPAAPAQPFRTDPYVGGSVAQNPPTTRTNPQTFSPTFNPAVPTGSCVYVGPTRVLLNGNGTATITSPQTKAAVAGADPDCYPAAADMADGIVQFVLDYTSHGNGVIYVKDNNKPAGGFTTTGQQAGDTANNDNSVFYLASTTPASQPDPDTSAAGDWTYIGDPQTWTQWTQQNCNSNARNLNTPNGPKPWDEQTFQCDWSNLVNVQQKPTVDGYAAYQQLVADQLTNTSPITVSGNAGNTVTYTVNGGSQQSKTVNCSSLAPFVAASATTDQTICLLQWELRQANSRDAQGNMQDANYPNPPKTGNTFTHQYIVDGYTQTSSTQQNVAVGPTPGVDTGGDKFFDSTTQAGQPSTENLTSTTTTYNIENQWYGCYKYQLPGPLGSPTGNMDIDGSSCKGVLGLLPSGAWAWGDGHYPGQSAPQFQVTVTQTTHTNFKTGSAAAAYFPRMNDVTQYTTGTAGANGGNGPGDVYVQGTVQGGLSLLADDDAVVTGKITRAGSSDGMLIDALGNVRVYHPVSCKVTPDSTTSPGYCPNDLTGLYTGGLDSDGTLSDAHPANQYVNMAGTDGATGGIGQIDAAVVAQGGSLLTDNFDRGAALGDLTINGGIYQLHRGALGVQWELLSTAATHRASSGYDLNMSYVNMQDAGLSYVPAFQGGTTGRYWNIVSISSAAS